jgi:hypothetical protein
VVPFGQLVPLTSAVSLIVEPMPTFVADWVVLMLGVRGVYIFVAGPELAPVPSVDRVTEAVDGPVPVKSGSLKLTVPVAFAVNVPGVLELIVIVQVAVLPDTTR